MISGESSSTLSTSTTHDHTVSEENVIREMSRELHETGRISEEQKKRLSKIFQKRLSQALSLVESGKVVRYSFQPSRRILWIVSGRTGEYQVIPESRFCTCDDYYFRVMANKRELCYHLLAQGIAEPLGTYESKELPDARYREISSKSSQSIHRESS